jgi:hypothetical protein
MPFTPKDWHDLPDVTTPLSAAAMEDIETRLSGYTDTQLAAEAAARASADTSVRADFASADTSVRADFATADTSVRTDMTAKTNAVAGAWTPIVERMGFITASMTTTSPLILPLGGQAMNPAATSSGQYPASFVFWLDTNYYQATGYTQQMKLDCSLFTANTAQPGNNVVFGLSAANTGFTSGTNQYSVTVGSQINRTKVTIGVGLPDTPLATFASTFDQSDTSPTSFFAITIATTSAVASAVVCRAQLLTRLI